MQHFGERAVADDLVAVGINLNLDLRASHLGRSFGDVADPLEILFDVAVIVGSELVSFSSLLTLRHAGIQPVAMLEESVRFFDAANKPERERWVANEFLGNLGVEFVESEIQCVADEPPDIRFRSASFEVKEILDKGRRRHLAYKAALEVANSASSPWPI